VVEDFEESLKNLNGEEFSKAAANDGEDFDWLFDKNLVPSLGWYYNKGRVYV